jgi:hypothetical protein
VQAVELNLATRPFKNDTLLWTGLILAVGLLSWLTWWNVKTWREHGRLLDALREGQANIAMRFEDLDLRSVKVLRGIDQVDLPALNTRSWKANEVIRWKSFSWTRLFNLLEQVQPYNVQMSSVHPVFRGDRRSAREQIEDLEQVPVSVEGTAKTLRDLLEFERELIFDPHFDRVEPENFATDENSGETIFRMRFLYDPRVGQESGIESEIAAQDPATGEDGPQPAGEAEPETARDTVADGEAIPTETLPAGAALEPEEDSALASGPLKKIKRGQRRRKAGSEPEAPQGVDSRGTTAADDNPDPDDDQENRR